MTLRHEWGMFSIRSPYVGHGDGVQGGIAGTRVERRGLSRSLRYGGTVPNGAGSAALAGRLRLPRLRSSRALQAGGAGALPVQPLQPTCPCVPRRMHTSRGSAPSLVACTTPRSLLGGGKEPSEWALQVAPRRRLKVAAVAIAITRASEPKATIGAMRGVLRRWSGDADGAQDAGGAGRAARLWTRPARVSDQTATRGARTPCVALRRPRGGRSLPHEVTTPSPAGNGVRR